MERNGVRIADCIEACCITCAKADFIGKHFIVDEAEAELNRMYALEDTRDGDKRWWAAPYYKGTPEK
jgi:hypothetical protein